jgi:hypothetical protein
MPTSLDIVTLYTSSPKQIENKLALCSNHELKEFAREFGVELEFFSRLTSIIKLKQVVHKRGAAFRKPLVAQELQLLDKAELFELLNTYTYVELRDLQKRGMFPDKRFNIRENLAKFLADELWLRGNLTRAEERAKLEKNGGTKIGATLERLCSIERDSVIRYLSKYSAQEVLLWAEVKGIKLPQSNLELVDLVLYIADVVDTKRFHYQGS